MDIKNREIKFRVFNKNDGKMYDAEAIEFVHIATVNLVQRVKIWIGTEMLWLNNKDFELMEYIGLKDKNEISIYEADIIKGSWDTILEVFYDSIRSAFCVRTVEGYVREISYYGQSKHLEILGNKYENPELFKTINKEK